MMRLAIQKFSDHLGHHVFGWWSGSKSGYISVPAIAHEKSELQAELKIINEFLFVRNILGVDVLQGTGIKLTVTNGQIKKLILKRTHCDYLEPLLRPLRLRTAGIDIEVHKGTLPPFPIVLDTDFPFDSLPELDAQSDVEIYSTFNTPKIGPVLITIHALEQYVERLEDATKPNRPLRSLINRLSNPKIAQIDLPERVHKHKDFKYGPEIRECWGHSSSDMHFMLVRRKSNLAILVTTYKRAPEYRNT